MTDQHISNGTLSDSEARLRPKQNYWKGIPSSKQSIESEELEVQQSSAHSAMAAGGYFCS